MINYDFGIQSGFTGTFSSSMDANIVFTIPYTPAVSTLFSTGATAYVSFTSITFGQSCTTYKVDATVLQVTSSSIQVRIQKTGNTVITGLKGQILVVASSAASNSVKGIRLFIVNF